MKKALTEYEIHNKRIPKIVSIEGNIGAGKSTLIQALRERYIQGKYRIIVILEEPVEIWNTVEEDGETLLEKFYKDPVKHGFTLQTMIYKFLRSRKVSVAWKPELCSRAMSLCVGLENCESFKSQQFFCQKF
jgi:deoxyadenosine/deoxycytidine kinase